MQTTMKVLGISGSLRGASHNTGLLRAAMELRPDGMTMTVAEIGALPFYNADLDGPGQPESVKEFTRLVTEADALLIATPEYNYSVSGVLKNAIDWASRPVKTSALNGKPIAMMGAGGMMGTVRAQLHLRQILMHNGALVLPKPELYIARSRDKFDANGNLVDEPTRVLVKNLLEALAQWTRQFNVEGKAA